MRYIVSYSQKFLTHHILWYAVVLLLAVKIVSVVFYIPFPNNFFFADITKSSLTHLLNGQRQEMGLNTLTQSQKLDQAAALKAQDMVAKGYFAHQSPQGTTPWHWFSQVGYKYNYAGENLAVGFIDSPEVFYAWLNSPSHKANMVNPNYTEVGTAIVSGFEGNSLVVVQLFGTPKAAAVTSNPKSETPRPEGARLASPSGEAAKPIEEPIVAVDNPDERVLSQSAQNVALTSPDGNTSSSPYSRWLNFIIYGNADYLQYIAYLLLAAVAVCLFINIVMAADKVHPALVVRSLVLLVILGISLVVDKDLMVYIIPHQLII